MCLSNSSKFSKGHLKVVMNISFSKVIGWLRIPNGMPGESIRSIVASTLKPLSSEVVRHQFGL